MKLKEYRQIKERLESQLAALETVWQLSLDNGIGENSPKKGDISKLVKEALERISGDFDVHKIETAIKKAHPSSTIKRGQISTVLKRLETKEKTIEQIKEGKGRSPAIYRKKA